MKFLDMEDERNNYLGLYANPNLNDTIATTHRYSYLWAREQYKKMGDVMGLEREIEKIEIANSKRMEEKAPAIVEFSNLMIDAINNKNMSSSEASIYATGIVKNKYKTRKLIETNTDNVNLVNHKIQK